MSNNNDNVCWRCPRHCHTDRLSSLGFCHASATPEVASICLHHGEEPPLCGSRGICNVFFAHCNLQCVYCQNLDISRATVDDSMIFYHSLDQIISRIEQLLPLSDNMLGFVSPSHYIDTLPIIVDRLRHDGFSPTVVYNSNAYDDPAALRTIEPYVDIYLPDLKYLIPSLAASLSNAADYPQRATDAILEMYRQKGSNLLCDDRGIAFRGMIVRHLVLPGHIDNSISVLDWIYDNLPHNIHLSLMAQYFPPQQATLPPELQRTLTNDEYQQVASHYLDLGFYNGWLQELSSTDNYHPDFSLQDSFADL